MGNRGGIVCCSDLSLVFVSVRSALRAENTLRQLLFLFSEAARCIRPPSAVWVEMPKKRLGISPVRRLIDGVFHGSLYQFHRGSGQDYPPPHCYSWGILERTYFSLPRGRNSGGNYSPKLLHYNSRGTAATRVKGIWFPHPPNYSPNSPSYCAIVQTSLKKSVCLKRNRVALYSLPN